MSRDRYTSILRHIRFSDPYDVDKTKKDTRLIGLMKILKETCEKYLPNNVLCIDESLLLFKGRIHFKIFIRSKRARFGVKVFLLISARGYMLDAIVYYGSRTNFQCNEPGTNALSKSELIGVIFLAGNDFTPGPNFSQQITFQNLFLPRRKHRTLN